MLKRIAPLLRRFVEIWWVKINEFIGAGANYNELLLSINTSHTTLSCFAIQVVAIAWICAAKWQSPYSLFADTESLIFLPKWNCSITQLQLPA